MSLGFIVLNINKVIVVALTMLIFLPVQAKRVALVMGNDNYTAVSKLQKAGNDASAMARELKNAGFIVQLHKDLNYRGMVRAVEAFTNNITGGDEVVVFFAGHGVQIKSGSYLLPTDIEANSESEVEKTAYELLALTDKISEAKPAFSLVLVDACRDNPLKSRGRSVGNARGLSSIEPPKGQMVVYSASRGQQALDRLSDKDPNPNGVFTREFIAQMQKPGVRIEDLMRGVQDSVETLAKSVNHDQRPAVYNEARGNFYFFGPTTVQVTQAQQKSDTNALELALWESVKNAATIGEIQTYLNRFPNGFFAELARLRIASMNAANIEKSKLENLKKLAAENSQRITNEKIKEESERKIAAQILEIELSQQRAKPITDGAQQKILAEEKAAQEAAERIALTTAAIDRAERIASQSETLNSENKSSIKQNLPTSNDAESGVNRVIEKTRPDSLQNRIESEKTIQEVINKNIPGSYFKECKDCPEVVVIPSGSFLMGSSSSWFSAIKPPATEQPSRTVSINSFAIGKYEVTQKQWREIMGTSPSEFEGDNLPVEQVSWDEVQEFLKKLSTLTGSLYRLPSEAEWEYAALAGQQTEYVSGNNFSEIGKFAWYFENSEFKTHNVGELSPNKFGLFDMYGNVEEMTSDCFNANFLNAPTDGSAWYEGLCEFRVVRGGSWRGTPRYLRAKSRTSTNVKVKDSLMGFRVVREFQTHR